MVKWTSVLGKYGTMDQVPGKTGTIHYFNNTNKYGAPANSGSVP